MEKSTLTVCPYCGAGRQINLLTENGKTVRGLTQELLIPEVKRGAMTQLAEWARETSSR